MGASIADRMSEQHDAIDARLAATAMHLDAGQLGMAADAATALAAALRHHAQVEEDHLFPAFARSPVADLEVLAAMHTQHAQIAALVATLSAAAAARDQGRAARSAGRPRRRGGAVVRGPRSRPRRAGAHRAAGRAGAVSRGAHGTAMVAVAHAAPPTSERTIATTWPVGASSAASVSVAAAVSL